MGIRDDMRTIYVILLGLILFQGVFIAFSSSFPYGGGIKENIDNPTTNETLSSFSLGETQDFWDVDGNLLGGGIGGFIGLLGFIYFLGTKNYPACGLCLFIGLIIGLLVSTWHTLSSINVTGNIIVAAIIDILFLVIGLLSLFAVIDMFAPQGAQQ